MINNIKGLLTEDEEVIYAARIHWIVFVPCIAYTIIGLLVGVFFHAVIGGLILLMTLYPLYNAIVHYTMTYLVLTNKKVLARMGFLSRDWIQMAFERIENAHLLEPIVGRFLGYSSVIVSGVGTGTIAIPSVINGDQFIKELEAYLDENRQEQKPQDFSEIVPELKRAAVR